MTEVSALTCPLCGKDNQCAAAQGKEAGSCWCHSVSIDRDILARLSSEQKNTVCLCFSCVSNKECIK